MVVDGAVLNVGCVVPMSAYEVAFSVSDGVIEVSVVVPGTADVILDGSASIMHRRQMQHIQYTAGKVMVS